MILLRTIVDTLTIYRRRVERKPSRRQGCLRGGGGGRLMGMLTVPARLLSDADRIAVERVLDEAPIAAAQVAERVHAAGLPWTPDARVFGYGAHRRLEAICWSGANLIPVRA